MKRKSNIEINLFYQNIRDAEIFIQLAEAERSKLKSFYARHSILSSVFSSEALINRVYDDFYLGRINDQHFSKHIERLPTPEKWILAPFVCGEKQPPGKTFNKGTEPFQSFKELIDIRHSIVHPKPKLFVKAEQDGTINWVDGPENMPFFKVLPSTEYWPHTKIPKNPFEIDETHAKKAFDTVQAMIDQLLHFFDGVFNKKWMLECLYHAEGDDEFSRLPIKYLWGGYTPSTD